MNTTKTIVGEILVEAIHRLEEEHGEVVGYAWESGGAGTVELILFDDGAWLLNDDVAGFADAEGATLRDAEGATLRDAEDVFGDPEWYDYRETLEGLPDEREAYDLLYGDFTEDEFVSYVDTGV